MAPAPVRVGIAGLGRSGWNIHARTLQDHQGFRVVAVADPLAERREEARQRFDCATYPRPEDMLAEADVDLVVVATPSHTHAALAAAALAAGRHVLVEKPMAQSVAEMDRMMAAAQAAGRVLTCFQQYRFNAVFGAVRELVTGGRLGRVVLVRHASCGYLRRADWQMLRRLGGGELSNNGPHYVDMALQLLGEGPVEVFADLQHTVGAGDAEDHVKLCLKGTSGLVVDIEISHTAAIPQPEWLAYGTAGALQSVEGGLRVRWLDPATLPPLQVDEGPAAGRRYQAREAIDWHEEILRPRQERSPELLYYDRLHATLTAGAPLAVTPESVRRQIAIIEQARAMTGLR